MKFDDYFMAMAFLVSEKSIDQSTKCGCIVVKDKYIVSTGFNGPPRGFPDKKCPQTRPEKYIYFEHSERNAIFCAARNGINIKDSTFYITGIPCFDCARGIIQVGAKKIIYGKNNANMTNGKEKLIKSIFLGQSIEILEYKSNEHIQILKNIISRLEK